MFHSHERDENDTQKSPEHPSNLIAGSQSESRESESQSYD